MSIRTALVALGLALAVTPAVAGPSGQHSAQSAEHGSAASAHGSAAVATGASIAVAVPVLGAGSAHGLAMRGDGDGC